MIVISDTSSLYYAAQIGCDDLFPRLFGEVYIPNAVRNELLATKSAEYISNLLSQPWLKVQPVFESPLLRDLLLKDELRGRAIAKKLQLTTVGLLGVFLLAKEARLVRNIRPLINSLVTQTKFRHSKNLIDSVLQKANEL